MDTANAGLMHLEPGSVLVEQQLWLSTVGYISILRREPSMSFKYVIAVCAVLAFAGIKANAQTTIYDTTGGNTAFTFSAYQIGPNPYYATAVEFNVASTANFSDVSLFLYSGDTSAYNVELTNSGLGSPGSAIDSWFVGGSDSKITLAANGTDLLTAGTYDIYVSSADTGDWSQSAFTGSDLYVGPDVAWHTSAPDSVLPEMEVQVDFVHTPEPSSFAVTGIGLSALLLRRRSSRRKV